MKRPGFALGAFRFLCSAFHVLALGSITLCSATLHGMEGEATEAPLPSREEVETLLASVKDLISAGDAQKSFALLLHTVRLTHPKGEDGIFDVLDGARDLINRARARDAVDEHAEALSVLAQLVESPSLLNEAGDEDILRDAYIDGSSVICTKCRGLVKKERWDSHRFRWCNALPPRDDDDDNDDEEEEDS